MTAPSVLCSRCGYANVPGDQFCGSCGAFLEWEGTPAGAEAGTMTTGPGTTGGGAASGVGIGSAPGTPSATGGLPASPDPAGSWGMGAPVAGATGSPVSAGWPSAATPTGSSAAAGADGLLRCPACGIANPASRTFCQSCGTKLTPAAAIPSKSREEIAAAVAAVPGTATRPPAGPGAQAAATTAAASAPAKKGGIAGWVIAIVVLGVLAGVGFVVVPQLLKGSGPSSTASAAPTPSGPAASSGQAAASPSGSATKAPASGAPASPGGATASPIAGKALKLTGASASSILAGSTADYGPQNAIDGSLKTSWQEGAIDVKGEWLEVSFAPSTVTSVVIRNGFQASTPLYRGNLRLKNILISVNGGAPVAARLKDAVAAQRIAVSPVAGATTVRITIVDTYPSVKTAVSGSPFQDAAISEIAVYGVVGG